MVVGSTQPVTEIFPGGGGGQKRRGLGVKTKKHFYPNG